MIESTLVGARTGWLAIAVGVHGLLFVAAGHVSTRGGPTRTIANVSEPSRDEVETVVEPEIDLTLRIVDEAAHLHSIQTHTHPYPVAHDHDTRPHDASMVHHRYALLPAPLANPTAHAVPEAPDDASTAPGTPPHFVMPPSDVSSSDHARGDRHDSDDEHGHAESGDSAEGTARAPLPTARVSTPSVCVYEAPGSYPEAARMQSIEATVRLEIVVDASGAVAQAKVVEHVGYGLDEAAIAAAKASRFTPARLAGRAVAERRAWSFAFTLR
ncbi:MAG: TonB family protein [Polyangiales bacterium]